MAIRRSDLPLFMEKKRSSAEVLPFTCCLIHCVTRDTRVCIFLLRMQNNIDVLWRKLELFLTCTGDIEEIAGLDTFFCIFQYYDTIYAIIFR